MVSQHSGDGVPRTLCCVIGFERPAKITIVPRLLLARRKLWRQKQVRTEAEICLYVTRLEMSLASWSSSAKRRRTTADRDRTCQHLPRPMSLVAYPLRRRTEFRPRSPALASFADWPRLGACMLGCLATLVDIPNEPHPHPPDFRCIQSMDDEIMPGSTTGMN